MTRTDGFSKPPVPRGSQQKYSTPTNGRRRGARAGQVVTPLRVRLRIVNFPHHLQRPIGLLLGLCVLAGVLVAGMTFPVVAGLGLVAGDAGDSVTSVSTDLVDGALPQATTLVDAAGQPFAVVFDQNRTSVTADEIAPAMKAAMVAIEDRRFYQHQGVDWQGTVRALIANSASGDALI